MTTYFCKCGRPVKKSANADNTGNRDTAGCEGCPYLLPWGSMVWEEGQKAYVQDVKGQECRMSPTINYATTYRGQADDKCTLHIVSLDLDFLDQVQAWIYDNAADTLSAGFSRGSMRAVEFCDQGRYSLSISCAQNKKGMAAKAALLDRFFTAGRGRRDMSPAQEKARILDAIRRGKEQTQRKDTAMKKLNDRCPLQQECERTCKVIGHERDCDYYVNNRYCTEGIPDQDELLAEEELRQEREREERYLASLSAEPAEPVIYQNEYGTLFAVREHKGAPALMCKAKGADSWALSGVLAAVRGEAYTSADLQEVLDEYARAHGWEKAAQEDLANPTIAAAGAPPCAPTVSDAQTSPSPNADAGAKTDGNGDVAACACAGCNRSDCICAGGHDVLGRADCDGRCNCSQSGCTYATRHPENPTAAGPASRADMSPRDTKTESNAPATPTTAMAASGNGLLPAFDFGADADTNAGLINDAQIFMAGSMARVMAAKRAHDRTANRYRGSWGKWCDFVGISRDTGDNMVRVAEQFGNIQVDGNPLIDLQPLKLLYATSKPSTPPEIRQQVENLDITSYKQYQEALAKIRARDAKITDLLEMSEAADRRADKAEQAAKDTARERDTALRRAAEAEKQRDGARDALQAAKLRGDKLKAENDALKAHPIEAQVVDEEEIDRRAQARADELTAPLREELEALRARHPADLEEAEQAIRDAYDSAVYTGRVIESAWRSLCPLLPRMDADRRELALNQIVKIVSTIQGECIKCL